MANGTSSDKPFDSSHKNLAQLLFNLYDSVIPRARKAEMTAIPRASVLLSLFAENGHARYGRRDGSGMAL